MALEVWDSCCTSGPFPGVVAGIQLVAHRENSEVRAQAVWRSTDKNLSPSECLGTALTTKLWLKLVMPFHKILFSCYFLSFPTIKSLLLSNIHREMGALNISSPCWNRWWFTCSLKLEVTISVLPFSVRGFLISGMFLLRILIHCHGTTSLSFALTH